MIRIRPYTPNDWPAVERIHAEGIATGLATFETEPKTQQAFEGDSVPASGLVAVDADDQVLGWAILWPVSDRCVYAGVAEVSVYVTADARGKGVGKTLLGKLVTESERLGIWTLQAGIFENNPGSIKLHESCGFRLVGVRERLGALYGEWRNVLLWERRSAAVGVD